MLQRRAAVGLGAWAAAAATGRPRRALWKAVAAHRRRKLLRFVLFAFGQHVQRRGAKAISAELALRNHNTAKAAASLRAWRALVVRSQRFRAAESLAALAWRRGRVQRAWQAWR
jgi:hypothetical protein